MEHIYKAEDGKEFDTSEACEAYEKATSGKTKYWIVFYNADCNETGRCQNKAYIKTIWEGFPAQQGNSEKHILEDFCYEHFGKRTAWIQGVAPCENWRLYMSTDGEFSSPAPIMWGGYPTETRFMVLGVGNRNKINVITDDILK